MKMRNKQSPCPRCKHPEFEVMSAQFPGGGGDGRPRFKCTACGDTWTSGHHGKPFLSGAKVS